MHTDFKNTLSTNRARFCYTEQLVYIAGAELARQTANLQGMPVPSTPSLAGGLGQINALLSCFDLCTRRWAQKIELSSCIESVCKLRSVSTANVICAELKTLHASYLTRLSEGLFNRRCGRTRCVTKL